MVDYFDLNLAVDPSGAIMTGATFQAFDPLDVSRANPLTVYEAASGVVLSSLMSSNVGTLPQFRVQGDLKEIILKSGTFETRLTSKYGTKGDPGKSAYDQAVEGGFAGTQEQFIQFLAAVGRAIATTELIDGNLILRFLDGTSEDVGQVEGRGIKSLQVVDGELLVTLTDDTVDNAGELPPGPPVSTAGATPGQVYTFLDGVAKWAAAAAGISGAPSTWPVTFPPSAHQHDVGDLRDSGSTILAQILAFLRADTIADARAAIGAGTGNSNLVIGTGAGNAAAGNHGHPASAITFAPSGDITATTVQTAILQAASLGGTSLMVGGLAVMIWDPATDTWPTRPDDALLGLWISTNDSAATVPTMDVSDIIIRHPDAVGA